MKIRNLMVLIASVFSLSANSATLVISGGQLMGATDVDVDGKFYNVSFLDGSCNSLYNGCSDFTFNTIDAAALASQALLDQVFIGVYDDEPALTNGIEFAPGGKIMTPAIKDPDTPAFVTGKLVWNIAPGFDNLGPDRVDDALAGVDQDWHQYEATTYAVWSEVPIPAAAWLFGSALLGLGVVKRKKA